MTTSDILGTGPDVSAANTAIAAIPVVTTGAANLEDVKAAVSAATTKSLAATAGPTGRARPIVIGLIGGLVLGYVL